MEGTVVRGRTHPVTYGEDSGAGRLLQAARMELNINTIELLSAGNTDFTGLAQGTNPIAECNVYQSVDMGKGDLSFQREPQTARGLKMLSMSQGVLQETST